MFVVESLELLVSYEFVASLFIMPIGLAFCGYALWLVWAKRNGRDLIKCLDCPWHVRVLQVFNIRLVRLLLLMSVVPSVVVFFQLAFQLLAVGMYEYDTLDAIPAKDFFPVLLLVAAAVLGSLMYLGLGFKGFCLPVGDKQSLSFDRKSTISIHIDDPRPDIAKEGDKLIPLISRLRAMGIQRSITGHSWLCVTRPQSADASVIGVRCIFRRMSDITL